jgi:hypothetical protein
VWVLPLKMGPTTSRRGRVTVQDGFAPLLDFGNGRVGVGVAGVG